MYHFRMIEMKTQRILVRLRENKNSYPPHYDHDVKVHEKNHICD